MENNKPQRKNIRLKYYDYTTEGMYFITICIKDRKNILGNIKDEKIKLTETGEIVKKYIQTVEKIYKNIKVDEYIVMPNHIHIIMQVFNKNDISISRIVKQYKGYITKEIGQSIWQKSFYEHIIRSEEEYYVIKEYVKNNIINWQKDKYF